MDDDWTENRETFLLAALENSRSPVVATDLRLPDQPLMYINAAFTALTGYPREETVGRNCRFLQGPDTDPATVARIRAAILAGEDAYFEILNYRRDGTAFWNGLHLSPVGHGDAKPHHYLGYQRDITAEVEARQRRDLLSHELRHRLGNVLTIVGMIVRTSRSDDGPEGLRKVLEGRINALAASNDLVYADRGVSEDRDGAGSQIGTSLETILRTVLTPTDPAGRIALRGPDLALSDQAVTNVALAIHELSTNAVKYGALSNGSGRIEISWRQEGRSALIDWTETGIVPDASRPEPAKRGMGTRLLSSIAGASARVDAGLERTDDAVTFRFDAGLFV